MMKGYRAKTAWTVGMAALAGYLGAQVLIPDGFLKVYEENFEDGTANGWVPAGGSWSILWDGGRVYAQGVASGRNRALAPAGSWTAVDSVALARVKLVGTVTTNASAGILIRTRDADNGYGLRLQASGALRLVRIVAGSVRVLSEAPVASPGGWHTLRVETTGSILRGYLDGILLVVATDTTFTSGVAGLETDKTAARFDDVVVAVRE